MTKQNENEPADKAAERLREFNRQRQPVPDDGTQGQDKNDPEKELHEENIESEELENDASHQSRDQLGQQNQRLINPQQQEDDENQINDNPFKNDVP